jgi:hypothetical protein
LRADGSGGSALAEESESAEEEANAMLDDAGEVRSPA